MSATTRPESHDGHSPRSDAREVRRVLQAAVVLMIDLQLRAKHAHWNVVGHGFRSMHTHLDDVVDLSREAADTFAERLRAVGSYPDTRLSVLAATATLPAAHHGPASTDQTARAIGSRLRAVSEELRAAQSAIETVDPPSADLLNQVVVEVEKHAWMLEAEVSTPGPW